MAAGAGIRQEGPGAERSPLQVRQDRGSDRASAVRSGRSGPDDRAQGGSRFTAGDARRPPGESLRAG